MSISFGKFDSVESMIHYRFLLNGDSDDSISFGDESGDWAERFNGPTTIADLVNVMGDGWLNTLVDEVSHYSVDLLEGGDHHGFGGADSDDEHLRLITDTVASLSTIAGFILTGDDRGFITGGSFRDSEALDQEWARLQGVADQIESDAAIEGGA